MPTAGRTTSPWAAALLLVATALHPQNQPTKKAGFPLDLGVQGPDCTATGDGGISNQGNNACANASTNLLVAELGIAPGFLEIAFGTGAGELFVIYRDPANGVWKIAPGWPRVLPSHAVSTPARADLDGNGTTDLVVGFGSTFQGNETPGGIRALRNDGTTMWTYNTQDVVLPSGSDGVYSSPAVADIDGDGHQEVVFSAFDHRLHVVDGRTGAAEPGWPKRICDTSFSSPALYDVDGDGLRVIIVGSDSDVAGDTVSGHVCAGTEAIKGHLWAFRWNGTLLPGFPKTFTDQIVQSSPAVGDIDGDGEAEIVHGTGGFYAGDTPRLYAWELDGSAVDGWPVNTSAIGRAQGSPALADIDGDDVLDVVVTTRTADGSLHYLAAYQGDNDPIFAPVVVRDFFGSSLSAGDPMVGDVFDSDTLDDDDPEILVPTNAELAVFSRTGARLTEIDGFDGNPPADDPPPNLNGDFTVNNGAIADLESGTSDGLIEIVMVSAKPFPSAESTVVHAWTPVSRAPEPAWGQFRHDARHLGVAADCEVLFENENVPGAEQVLSCGVITVRDVTVTATGDLVLEAADAVVLSGGTSTFSVAAGGGLRVRVG